MAQAEFLLKLNPARPAVDARGQFTAEVARVLSELIRQYNANVAVANGESLLLTDAQFITAAANASLTSERIATDTATIAWDFATAGQAKASVPDAGISTAKLGGDITAAGKALIDDASAAAQQKTLGITPARLAYLYG